MCWRWTGYGRERLRVQVVRDESGNAMATFDSWEEAVNAAYMSGARSPRHIVTTETLR